MTLTLEYLSSGPDAERWLKAFEDPLASIYTKSLEKSRGEGSLIVQDTIENVSEPKFFL